MFLVENRGKKKDYEIAKDLWKLQLSRFPFLQIDIIELDSSELIFVLQTIDEKWSSIFCFRLKE